jgi:hypothetical protein
MAGGEPEQFGKEDLMRSISIAEWVTAVSLIMAVATPLPCLAQRGNFGQSPPQQRRQVYPYQNRRPAPGGPQGHAGDWLRRYKDLPPAEQLRALQNDPQFRHLPPGRQQELQRQLQHFSTLPPQQQQRVLHRMETWEHLTPQQKQQARQIFGEMQQLPPNRRRMVGTAIRDLRAMPPRQREQIIGSPRFRSMFSPQERDLMRGATRLPLAGPEGGRGEQSSPGRQ